MGAHPRLPHPPLQGDGPSRAVVAGGAGDGDPRQPRRADRPVPRERPHLPRGRRAVHRGRLDAGADRAGHRAGKLAPAGRPTERGGTHRLPRRRQTPDRASRRRLAPPRRHRLPYRREPLMIRFLAFCLLLAAVPAAAAPLAHRPDGVELRTAAATVRVTALTNDILRVRIARAGRFDEDASWAVAADIRARHIAVAPTADGFATATLRVRLVAGRLVVEDKAGKLISADAVDPVKLDGRAFTLRKQLPLSTHIFGLGDKTGGLDRRGKAFVDWNTDAYGFSSADDPIYKSIPFFLAVGGEGGSYGLFLDNTRRTWFDFGHREEDVITLGGPDGPIDYYLIAGPSTAEVVRRYTDLTGKPPPTPL